MIDALANAWDTHPQAFFTLPTAAAVAVAVIGNLYQLWVTR